LKYFVVGAIEEMWPEELLYVQTNHQHISIAVALKRSILSKYYQVFDVGDLM